jgi:hypothetical protein
VIRQMVRIAKAMIGADCVHREINPAHLIFTRDGRVVLVDLQWTCSASNYQERPEILANPQYIRFLGEGYSMGRFIWDDMFSMFKILKLIGCKDSYRQSYEQAEAFFKTNLGKRIICYPYRRRLLFKKKLLHILAGVLPCKTWRDWLRSLYIYRWFGRF